MSALHHLITVATEYARAEGVELKTVSWRVFGDGKKLDAIRDRGSDIQVRRFEGAMIWFSNHWPLTASWPLGVPRPPEEAPANDDPASDEDPRQRAA